jgi:transposase
MDEHQPNPIRTAAAKEARRKRAVGHVLDGRTQQDVADFLGVHPVTVAKWMAKYRAAGETALAAKPTPGRPRFLTPEQEGQVLAWLVRPPTEFGFRTDLWTAARVAQLVRQKFDVRFHPSYLREWLAKRGCSPQKPARRAKQQKPAVIDRWLSDEYPMPKTKPRRATPTSC